MEWIYWKVVIRYGHVGIRKEVSVSRYLATPSDKSLVDVMDIVADMPGTKHRPLLSISKISNDEYLEGLQREKENFYLQQLFLGNVAI